MRPKVSSGISPSFERLSRTGRQVVYVLLTRAPLYSLPEGSFLVRLACVRHAASVRSEPGSNSRVFTTGGEGPCGPPPFASRDRLSLMTEKRLSLSVSCSSVRQTCRLSLALAGPARASFSRSVCLAASPPGLDGSRWTSRELADSLVKDPIPPLAGPFPPLPRRSGSRAAARDVRGFQRKRDPNGAQTQAGSSI